MNDAPVDLPSEGAEVDVSFEDTIDDPLPEIEPPCTPGETCPGGGYCCNIGGSLGCFETALDCDCGDSDAICTSQGMICCETEPGVRKCKPDMQGCLCLGAEDSARCGEGKICCADEPGGRYACTSEREGCLCSIADPAAAAYCGEGRICCNTGDYFRCTADTSACTCSILGNDPAECGERSSYCCIRGAGMTCGEGPAGCQCAGAGDPVCMGLTCCDRDGTLQCDPEPEGCPCEAQENCSEGYVCCAHYLAGSDKFCYGSVCYCLCDDVPGGDCRFLGEDSFCRDIAIGKFCDKSWGGCL